MRFKPLRLEQSPRRIFTANAGHALLGDAIRVTQLETAVAELGPYRGASLDVPGIARRDSHRAALRSCDLRATPRRVRDRSGPGGLTSGKFDTSTLVMAAGTFGYNVLRWIRLTGLIGSDSPVRHPAKRRRVRTVMKGLIATPA